MKSLRISAVRREMKRLIIVPTDFKQLETTAAGDTVAMTAWNHILIISYPMCG